MMIIVFAAAMLSSSVSTPVVATDVDPESVLYVLSQLQIEPRDACMVGDTLVDIGAGKNAGVAKTIGVTHGFGSRESLEVAQADFIVDRLMDIEDITI